MHSRNDVAVKNRPRPHDTANETPPRQRFTSSIIGQSATDDPKLSIPLMIIAMFATTVAFITSLSWAALIDSTVIAASAPSTKMPLPVSRLIAALVVTGTSIGVLAALFQWESKVAEDV